MINVETLQAYYPGERDLSRKEKVVKGESEIAAVMEESSLGKLYLANVFDLLCSSFHFEVCSRTFQWRSAM